MGSLIHSVIDWLIHWFNFHGCEVWESLLKDKLGTILGRICEKRAITCFKQSPEIFVTPTALEKPETSTPLFPLRQCTICVVQLGLVCHFAAKSFSGPRHPNGEQIEWFRCMFDHLWPRLRRRSSFHLLKQTLPRPVLGRFWGRPKETERRRECSTRLPASMLNWTTT